MPRMLSIARRSPTRSSKVRCSVTVSRAVSVAIAGQSPFLVGARPGSSGAPTWSRRTRAGSPLRVCRLGAKVTLRGVEHPQSVERLWLTRLRWRLRGAWLWPAFFGFTLIDGLLIWRLPPYEGAPPGVVGGWLLAGFANLLLIAVAAPLAALALRRRRRDLPQLIAT